MPGLPCSYGDVTKIDLPMPFFLRDDAFANFKNTNYNWEPSSHVTVLVKTLKKAVLKDGQNDVEQMDDESIGGCPLECPFDPNENFEEAVKPMLPEPIFPGLDFPLDVYDSMELQTCRRLVRKIYDGDEETLQNLRLDRVAGKYSLPNPVYVACDGSPNAKDLVMIGFDEQKFLELRMMGPYKRQATQLNLDLFLAYHQHLPNVNPTSIQKQVHAVYEKSHSQYPSNGKLFIEFLWADPKALFEQPPPLTCAVKLAVKPKPGDANPSLKKLWQEVSAVETFIKLLDANVDGDRTILGATLIEAGASPTAIEIKNMLGLPSVPNWKTGLNISDSFDAVIKTVMDLDRSDIDFTDKFWSVIKGVSQPHELCECFLMVFSHVEKKLYRPYLFPSNTTTMCQSLQKVSSGNANFRSGMTPNKIFEMTINCGMHKLYKDYLFILTACKLADPSSLKAFAPNGKSIREGLSDLKKLHCILEIVCICKDRLALSSLDQEGQVKVLLQHFLGNRIDWDRTFHFDVPFNAVANHIVGVHPSYWNLKLESSNAQRITRTNAILSRDFFVGHAKKFYINNDGLLPRGYYLYVHRIAQRKL